MITLGIESSCDETSVAILKYPNRVLANITLSSLKEHKRYGGVVPEIASRAHVETILPCLDLALKRARLPGGQARVALNDVDLIAVTEGPGLMGSLLVGISAAKALSWALRKPLVGVNHVIAHIYAGFLPGVGARQGRAGTSPPRFPVLGLVVSGGHTMLIRMDSARRIKILGNTRDDAAGEAFDKVAKMMYLGYPGGPEIDRLAKGQDPNRIFFTRPFLEKNSLDFSFSGIKTAVFYKIKEMVGARSLPGRQAGSRPGWENPAPTPIQKRLIAAGFQEAVCDVLVEKALRAARKEKLRTVIVGGGVSANSRLREKLRSAGKKEGLKMMFPGLVFCQDNAAMIAGLGAALYKEGRRDGLDLSGYSDFHPMTRENLNGNKIRRI